MTKIKEITLQDYKADLQVEPIYDSKPFVEIASLLGFSEVYEPFATSQHN